MQSQWLIQCLYISGKALRQFKPVARQALALVPVKLVKNWQAKYTKFLDINNLKLNLKMCIGHRSATINIKIGIKCGKEKITLKEMQT